MCGITGFSHMTDTTRRMLPYLMWEMENRGHDSWGGTDGVNFIRQLGPITESFHKYIDDIMTWQRGIFHTRGASTGSVSIDNCHPFESHSLSAPDGSPHVDPVRIIGIHNGVLTNHSELNTRHHRNFSCDSMHIFANLAEDKPTEELHGYGNLAWYRYANDTPDGLLQLCRFNSDALHVYKLEGGEILFSSTADSVQRAARMVGAKIATKYNIDNEYIYYPEFDNGVATLFKSAERTSFGTRHTPYNSGTDNNDYFMNGRRYVPNGTHVAHNMSVWENSIREREAAWMRERAEHMKSNSCVILGCKIKVTPNRNDAVVCQEHLDEILEQVTVREESNAKYSHV